MPILTARRGGNAIGQTDSAAFSTTAFNTSAASTLVNDANAAGSFDAGQWQQAWGGPAQQRVVVPGAVCAPGVICAPCPGPAQCAPCPPASVCNCPTPDLPTTTGGSGVVVPPDVWREAPPEPEYSPMQPPRRVPPPPSSGSGNGILWGLLAVLAVVVLRK